MELLPPVPIDVALARASERRRWIRGSIRDGRDPVRYELVELPEGVQAGERQPFREEGGELSSAAQMTRLTWQLSSPAALLAERAADFVYLQSKKEFGAEYVAKVVDGLRIVPTRMKLKRGTFPWKVVVEVRRTHETVATPLLGAIRANAPWFGVGIDVEFIDEERGFRPLGHCIDGEGHEGVVGGALVDNPSRGGGYDADWHLLTCAHVISPNCGSRSSAKPQVGVEGVPDAVLLRRTPCFQAPGYGSPALEVWDARMIQECAAKRALVERQFAGESRRKGFIESMTTWVALGSSLIRFPHALVSPRLMAYAFGLIKTPLFDRPFSRPGDSGMWVVEAADRAWIGMVVGGDPTLGRSYVAVGWALRDYFERQQGLAPGALSPIIC